MIRESCPWKLSHKTSGGARSRSFLGAGLATLRRGDLHVAAVFLALPAAGDGLRLDAALAEPAHHGLAVAVRHPHPPGARRVDGGEERGPVHVVRQDEAAVDGAAAALAADAHPAAGEG